MRACITAHSSITATCSQTKTKHAVACFVLKTDDPVPHQHNDNKYHKDSKQHA